MNKHTYLSSRGSVVGRIALLALLIVALAACIDPNGGGSTEDPYDADGYDREGFNREGIHRDKPIIIQEVQFGLGGTSFGDAVAFSSDGNTVLVGAPGVSGSRGAAYVFTRHDNGTWTQQAPLDAGGGAAVNDEFGHAVALSADGNTALIGAWKDDPTGTFNGGSVYIFTRTGTRWLSGTQYTADMPDRSSGTTSNGNFGTSVALSGDGNTAFIGAPLDDDPVFDAGAVYVFIRQNDGTWIQGERLTASAPSQDGFFGTSVALSGDGILPLSLVQAPEDADHYGP